VRFPAPYQAGKPSSKGTGRPAIGSGRGTTSHQPAKGAGAGRGVSGTKSIIRTQQGTTPKTQRSTEQLRDRRKSAVASRTVSRDDILKRYRGSNATRRTDAPNKSVQGPASVRAPKLADGQDPAPSSVRGNERKDTQGKLNGSKKDFGRKAVSTPIRGEASPKAYGRGIEQRAKALGIGRNKKKDMTIAAGAVSGTGVINGVIQPIGSVGAYADQLHASHYNSGYYYGNTYLSWCNANYWGCGSFSLCWAPFAILSSCWWNGYWSCGGYWSSGYCPNYYWYGPFISPRYSVVYPIYEERYEEVSGAVYYEDELEEEELVEEGEGGVVFIQPPPAAGNNASKQRSLGRVAHHYMGLGDEAFSGGRWGDAAHFYAKSVEFSPDEGVLYLVLSDALFATGDYRYAAFSLRKALELDPSVLAHIVDKRSFYANAGDFDRQLALLETYLKDHFLDEDARLVLAANYLFGGRPAAAVDLLEDPFSAGVTASLAGKALLDAARTIQFGEQAPEGRMGEPAAHPADVPFGPDEEI
jgi:hypothetical protein